MEDANNHKFGLLQAKGDDIASHRPEKVTLIRYVPTRVPQSGKPRKKLNLAMNLLVDTIGGVGVRLPGDASLRRLPPLSTPLHPRPISRLAIEGAVLLDASFAFGKKNVDFRRLEFAELRPQVQSDDGGSNHILRGGKLS
jgi:hypothetical protein